MEQNHEIQLRQVLQAANLGIWSFDPIHQTFTGDDAVSSQWNLKSNTFSFDNLLSKIHSDDRTLFRDALKNAELHGKRYFVEFRILKNPGEIAWIQSQGERAIGDDGTERILGTSLDVTERKDAELKLRFLTKKTEYANAAKTQFLANMSHEIRTPLGAIMGFVRLLKDSATDPQMSAHYLSILERNSDHLLRLVDDILDLSKVDAGKMPIELLPFSLPDFLSETAALMKFRAADKGIEFHIRSNSAIPQKVISDPTRLRQILSNVIGNAVKFTERGKVEVEVSYEAPHLNIRVADTGVGISEAQQKKLFQPFSQADASSTRKFGGTGLGLILTKKLCELLGGEFKLVQSTPSHGSTFHICIQLHEQKNTKFIRKDDVSFAGGEVSASGKKLPSLAGLNVLVVEDSVDNQELIQIILSQAGANVEIAFDGKQGLEMSSKKKYDVILMDIQMPRMDGYEATRRLRESGTLAPVVALTAHAMKEERDRCLASGFSHFLTKPILPSAMIGTLEQIRKRKKVSEPVQFPLFH